MTSRHLFLTCLCPLLVCLGSRLPAADYAQWDLDGDLESNTGNPPLVALASTPAADAEVSFETVQIGGQDAQVAHFTQGTYFEVPHGLPPNGGGSYINQYTLIMDILFPDRTPSGSLTSLLQTNCCNQNNGDWFIDPSGGLGSLGIYGGSIPDGEWHRIALVVDLVAGTLTSFIDGVPVHVDSGQALDGQFSIYSPLDGDPDPYETFFVFADDSGENSEGFVNSIQFHDQALASGVIAEIGGPTAGGIPKDVCILPPAIATRGFTGLRTAAESNGDFLPGDLIGVEIALSAIRAAAPPCTAPGGVVIVETLPAGWVPSEISDDGVRNVAANAISWTITGAGLAEGKVIRYKATAAAAAGQLAAAFAGTIAENLPGAKSSEVKGETALLSDIPFDACGGIRCWNILGCFIQPANSWPDGVPGSGDSPGIDHMRLDFLTDGEALESTFIWYPGARIATAFGGDGVSAAVSTGLQSGTLGRNPDGVPEAAAWNDRDSFINLNDDVYGGNPDTVMAYMQCYVINSGPDREVQIGSDSDDSILVLLNDEEVWGNSVARGSGACEFSDKSPDLFNYPGPILLRSGENKLVVKVFEGAGGFNAQFRFEDPISFEPITDLGISKLPAGICTVAPLKASRDIASTETVLIQHASFPRWKDGETYDVKLSLSDIRSAGAPCAAPATVILEEFVPAGWTPSDASNGGRLENGKITWTLTGGQIAPGDLTYKAKAAGTPGQALFRGKVKDEGSPVTSAVTGESALENPNPFTDQCFIADWLLLGPFAQPGLLTANPGVSAIQQDHLCDGAGVTEIDIEPKAGDVVHTSFTPPAGGCARSTGLRAGVTTSINPGGTPTWFPWHDADDTVNFDHYYGANLDRLMMYAVTYIEVDAPIPVDIGLDSDDSVQVLLDGSEIWVNNVARAMGGANTVVDVISSASVPALNPLPAGRHKLMVKVFEGLTSNGFRLRFQDPITGEGICSGIRVCLDPQCSTTPPLGKPFHRGDADQNGELELTDAVVILGYLFLGTGSIDCLDASDADDNGSLELTDAVRILYFLFLGLESIPAPGPTTEPCGPDPTPEDPPLGCESYTPCGA